VTGTSTSWTPRGWSGAHVSSREPSSVGAMPRTDSPDDASDLIPRQCTRRHQPDGSRHGATVRVAVRIPSSAPIGMARGEVVRGGRSDYTLQAATDDLPVVGDDWIGATPRRVTAELPVLLGHGAPSGKQRWATRDHGSRYHAGEPSTSVPGRATGPRDANRTSGHKCPRAAGNEGDAGMGFPGAYEPVISAGAGGWVDQWNQYPDKTWWLDDVPENGVSEVYVPGSAAARRRASTWTSCRPAAICCCPIRAPSSTRTAR
jgi:hypothetical protein